MELNTMQPPIVGSAVSQGKKQSPILIIVLIALVIIIAATGWFFRDILFTKKTSNLTKQTTTPATNTVSEVTGAVEENYKSEKFQYSVKYPDGWFSVPNVDEVENYKVFSNEDVSSKESLSLNGIFVSIEKVTQNIDFYQNILDSELGLFSSDENGTITKLSDLTIDNQTAAKFSYETISRESATHFYAIDYVFKKGDSFYLILVITRDKSVADKNMDIFDKMADSFRILQ